MVSINTNLSSLIVQNNLTNSTTALNKAIERMTTGFKINHASDNAANYSISQNMVSQLSSYDVATDNISMGLDMVNTAQDTISEMQNRTERLMHLWTQAQNGTYGEDSLNAIQSEVNALVQEINRLYDNTEYNGIKLLGYDLPDWAEEVRATAGNIDSAETHHIDDADVEEMTHVAGLANFNSGTTFAITTVDDLANLATLVNSGKDTTGKTFVMGADLDLSAWCAEHMDPSGVGGWNAIGTDSKQFKGTFDGNGHVITGLTINKPTENNQGLFGYASDTSTIKNVGVEGCDVSGRNNVSSLVGWSDGSIESCYATGTVSGTGYSIGGLVGVSLGSIESSYSTGDVSGNDSVGGIVGYSSGTIESCYSTGDVSGNDSVGGLVGRSDEGTIESCYSTGDVSGGENSSYIGGLVGDLYGTIESSYSTGAVSGQESVGGLVGYLSYGGIESCYSTGSVSGNHYIGGFVGEVLFCYNDIELTDVASYGNVNGDSIVGSLIGSAYYEVDGCQDGTLTITNAISSSQNGLGFIGGATYYSDATYVDPDYDMTPWLDNIEGVQTQTTLQVGINGDSSSQITTNTHLNNTLKVNNIASKSAYDEIQGFLDKLSARATELGAVSNRLESALESTTVSMENLTSSLSTVRDADISKVSSDYIKHQILQQASATLLATANQSPSIALQLI